MGGRQGLWERWSTPGAVTAWSCRRKSRTTSGSGPFRSMGRLPTSIIPTPLEPGGQALQPSLKSPVVYGNNPKH